MLWWFFIFSFVFIFIIEWGKKFFLFCLIMLYVLWNLGIVNMLNLLVWRILVFGYFLFWMGISLCILVSDNILLNFVFLFLLIMKIWRFISFFVIGIWMGVSFFLCWLFVIFYIMLIFLFLCSWCIVLFVSNMWLEGCSL